MFSYEKIEDSPFAYVARKGYQTQTPLRPPHNIEARYATLYKSGLLIIKPNYFWDGTTGAFNTKGTHRASYIHDVLTQMMAEKRLSLSHRKAADDLFKQICLEDGVSKFRANYMYLAIRIYGHIRYEIF